MKISPLKAVSFGALLGLGCVALIGAAGLNKYTGQFFGDGSGLTNVPAGGGFGSTITNGVFHWDLDGTFEDTLQREGSHGVILQYDHIDGSGATMLWRTTDGTVHFANSVFTIDGLTGPVAIGLDASGHVIAMNGSGAIVQNFFSTNIYASTNYIDYFNSYSNAFLTFETNAYFNQNINVSGKATFNQFLVLSNGLQFAEVAWSGPTNNVDLNTGRAYYSGVTPIQISGLLNKSTTNVQPFTLKFKNTSGTNVTATIASGIIDLNYSQQYTVTNGLIYSIEYDPSLSLTNGVGRVW